MVKHAGGEAGNAKEALPPDMAPAATATHAGNAEEQYNAVVHAVEELPDCLQDMEARADYAG